MITAGILHHKAGGDNEPPQHIYDRQAQHEFEAQPRPSYTGDSSYARQVVGRDRLAYAVFAPNTLQPSPSSYAEQGVQQCGAVPRGFGPQEDSSYTEQSFQQEGYVSRRIPGFGGDMEKRPRFGAG